MLLAQGHLGSDRAGIQIQVVWLQSQNYYSLHVVWSVQLYLETNSKHLLLEENKEQTELLIEGLSSNKPETSNDE